MQGVGEIGLWLGPKRVWGIEIKTAAQGCGFCLWFAEASASFAQIPSPLAGEGQGEGELTSFPGEMPANAWMAWLCHAGHEGAALDRVSPALRAGASDFGKTQSHQRSSPRQTTRFAGSLVSSNGSDGAPQTAHPCAGCGCAIIPDGAPDPLNSTRRFAGGTNTVPARGFSVHVGRISRRRGEQCKRLAKSKSGIKKP